VPRMYIGAMLNTSYSPEVLTILEFSRHFVEKYSSIQFQENPSFCIRTDRLTRGDEQTDVIKLIVAFRNFANSSYKGP
jgi:phospholipid N-methyltransferase